MTAMTGASKAPLLQPSHASLRHTIRRSVVTELTDTIISQQSRSLFRCRAVCWHSHKGRVHRVTAASTAAKAAAAAAAAEAWVSLQPAAAKGQLYEATLGDGHSLWLEVIAAKGPWIQLMCYGEALEVNLSVTPPEVRQKGYLPRLSEPWLRRCPGLAESLTKIRKHQQEQRQQQGQGDDGSLLPSQLLAQHGVSQLRLVTSMSEFAAQVQQHPALWCDGTGPDDPPLTAEQTVLLSAGELLAFLQGSRGVCIVQLYKGWGEKGADQQPLLRPFVMQLLQRAAEDKGVLLMGSAAPEGLGASLLICPRQQPFKAWAEHLAGVGVQAALVAESPFYKLLVGRILGYKEENIYHHIKATGGSLDGKVIAAVDEELKSLSGAAAVSPWKRRA